MLSVKHTICFYTERIKTMHIIPFVNKDLVHTKTNQNTIPSMLKRMSFNSFKKYQQNVNTIGSFDPLKEISVSTSTLGV